MDLLKLKRYVGEITGEEFHAIELDPGLKARLPLFLKSAYRLMDAEIFNRRFILALQNKENETQTPQQYARQVDQLRTAMGKHVALVLPQVKPFERNRLLRQGVPFIVPGHQMFLPFVAMDLRERFPKRYRKAGQVLTPPAQVVLFKHLLNRHVEGLPLHELAQKLKYSAMTLSNVADELKAMKFCEVLVRGREKHLQFSGNRLELWNRTLPHAQTPVRKKYWAIKGPRLQHAKMAGMTALAHYTLLSDDQKPTCAMRDSEFRELKDSGILETCEIQDDAGTAIETWAYDPAILAEGEAVDPLSLYMSLKDMEDARVQKALKEILEALTW